MKKIMLKEWRHELKVALIGMALLTVVLIRVYKTCTGSLASVAAEQGWLSGEVMQPLLSPDLRVGSACFCALFGLVLGWLQIRAEKHPDLWAFLIHRPMTRGAILCGKVAGGLSLYALGAGLPLLVFIAFIRAPGHAAAPFEWPMALPVAAIFLLGMVFYFAGMLTGLRQARWYGSRGFGLGVAVCAAIGSYNADEFWQALLVLLATGSVLAVAVRGSFETGGYYRGQTVLEKLALMVSCIAATIILVGVAIWGVSELLGRDSVGFTFSQYAMTTNGVVYKVTRHGEQRPEIMDLNGKPLLDEKTGAPLNEREFDRRRAFGWTLFARFDDRREVENMYQPGYSDHARFFSPWQLADKTFWYWTHDGRVVGYDPITRRRVATLEAGGNSAGSSMAATGFLPTGPYGVFNSYESKSRHVLASPTTVYLANLADRTLKPVFNITGDDRIGGYADASGNLRYLAVVVTRKSVQLLDMNGQLAWSVPQQPSYQDYPEIQVSWFGATTRFAVEFHPDAEANRKTGGKLPIRIEWITAGQGITKTLDLPTLPDPTNDNYGEKLTDFLMPPPLAVAIGYGVDSERLWGWLSVIPAILCVMVGGWLGRRNSFSARAQVGWGVFHLIFGLPGLLALLSVQEWPAREPCIDCKKLRVVDRERCPHCGADFAPPEKNGTEIFESLTAHSGG